MQATRQPAWAALSTSGLRTLELPDHVRDVVVLADGDEPGEAAARDAALRWKREGRRVRTAQADHQHVERAHAPMHEHLVDDHLEEQRRDQSKQLEEERRDQHLAQ